MTKAWIFILITLLTLLNYLVFQSSDFAPPKEGYSRKVSCALILISTFH
jgi:hypothetical protein